MAINPYTLSSLQGNINSTLEALRNIGKQQTFQLGKHKADLTSEFQKDLSSVEYNIAKDLRPDKKDWKDAFLDFGIKGLGHLPGMGGVGAGLLTGLKESYDIYREGEKGVDRVSEALARLQNIPGMGKWKQAFTKDMLTDFTTQQKIGLEEERKKYEEMKDPEAWLTAGITKGIEKGAMMGLIEDQAGEKFDFNKIFDPEGGFDTKKKLGSWLSYYLT